MRNGASRAKAQSERSEEGTAISVECSPEGDVLLLITSPGYAVPAVFGFDPVGAHRFAKTMLEAAQEALAIRSKHLRDDG